MYNVSGVNQFKFQLLSSQVELVGAAIDTTMPVGSNGTGIDSDGDGIDDACLFNITASNNATGPIDATTEFITIQAFFLTLDLATNVMGMMILFF
jgi:hypothetical protein